MTLYTWVREYIKKLSFVDDVTMRNAIVSIIYTDLSDKKRKVTLPYRANKKQLLNKLELIKKEIKYYERKEERLKNLELSEGADLVYTTGETNE